MSDSQHSGKTSKIYCANCKNCKIINMATDDGQSVRRVRCAAGHWRKKLGEEKIYKYFTVTRRTMTECPDYEEMGDPRTFMKELKKTLPSKDESYAIH